MLAMKELVGPGGERGRSDSSNMGGGIAALDPRELRISSSYANARAAMATKHHQNIQTEKHSFINFYNNPEKKNRTVQSLYGVVRFRVKMV